MTREELVNSTAYKVSNASIEYWRKNQNNVQDDNGQLCDAFEAGADFRGEIDIKKAWQWINNKVELTYTDYDSFLKAMNE